MLEADRLLPPTGGSDQNNGGSKQRCNLLVNSNDFSKIRSSELPNEAKHQVCADVSVKVPLLSVQL